MEAISEFDGDFEEDTDYGIYINWGIFDSHADQGVSKVRGMTEEAHVQYITVHKALKASTLIASIATIASAFAFSL